VHYLPYACDAELHSRPLSYPKTVDVALVGSIRDDRVKLQKELAKHGVVLELMSNVFREQYIDALASAKMIINQNPPEGRGLLNMRFWEAQAAGAVICTEHDDIHANWDIGLKTNGVLCYQDVQQLAANCKMFLAQDSSPSISSIATCSQASALQNHSYQNRCKQILETVFPHG
jgi:spore maturation protein CgeB